MVWGPVVWIPWIPLWMGFLLRAEQGPSSFISHKIHGTGIFTCMNGWCLSVFMSIYHVYIYIDPVGIAPQNVYIYRTLHFSDLFERKCGVKPRTTSLDVHHNWNTCGPTVAIKADWMERSDFQRWCSGRGISHTCRADSDLDGHANLICNWTYWCWRGRRAATWPWANLRQAIACWWCVAHEDSQRERGDRRYAAPDRTRVLREGRLAPLASWPTLAYTRRLLVGRCLVPGPWTFGRCMFYWKWKEYERTSNFLLNMNRHLISYCEHEWISTLFSPAYPPRKRTTTGPTP